MTEHPVLLSDQPTAIEWMTVTLMKLIVFFAGILALTISLSCCAHLQREEDPHDLIEVSAQIKHYLPTAAHVTLDQGSGEWLDSVVFRITAPKDWKGTELAVYCKSKTRDDPFRQIGSQWTFKIEKKRLVGRYPGTTPGTVDAYPASEGDLKQLARTK